MNIKGSENTAENSTVSDISEAIQKTYSGWVGDNKRTNDLMKKIITGSFAETSIRSQLPINQS